MKPASSGNFKPTKARLKRVRMQEEYLIKAINSDTRPKRKKANEPIEPGEIPIGRYRNVVMVPVTMENREMFRQKLKELKEEENSIKAALGARQSWPKIVIKPKAKNSAKKRGARAK